ncbi:MAG: hypothetical protein ACRDAX_08650 [Propionibacteriaceae bacterium]
MAVQRVERGLSDEVVEERIAKMQAGMGLAGHEITDPVILDLLRSFARGEITREECFARGKQCIEAQVG